MDQSGGQSVMCPGPSLVTLSNCDNTEGQEDIDRGPKTVGACPWTRCSGMSVEVEVKSPDC